MASTTVVSSPGKVLLAGGYLVLDPRYSGVVVSTSSRFYTVIHRDLHSKGSQDNGLIRVRSPQFLDAVWQYSVTVDGGVVDVAEHANRSGSNKFIHLALQKTFSLAAEVKGAGALKDIMSQSLDITVVGDNDFYSQRAQLAAMGLPRTLESLLRIPPFTPTGVRLSDVHKTGLGSSAALITSFVCALLLHLQVVPPSAFSQDGSEGRRMAHNLAQFVHCFAQGKVGSGFDVSSAVFGSQLYTRFDPTVLDPIMGEDVTTKSALLPILSPTNTNWNYTAEPFHLPPLTRLMLADVDAGSNTPSLVGKVLGWRKKNSKEAHELWTELDNLNQMLARTLLNLSDLHAQDPENYTEAVKYLSTLQAVQWPANPWQPPSEEPIVQAFYDAHTTTQAIRAKMREMGTLTGAEIEPSQQSVLLNRCASQAGVIGGGVPGAGGYDAIWLLVCDPVDCSPDPRPSDRIERLWSTYTDLDVSPLSATESAAKGTRIESIESVAGLEHAVFGSLSITFNR